MNIDKIIKELNKLNMIAESNGEVPISALIIKDDKIIAKAYNQTEKKQNILSHAEIICINKASKKLNNWRLDGCTMYVTLEPCNMCKEIIKKSRIKKINYFIKQNNNKTEKDPKYNYIDNDILSSNLTTFFKNIR